ncbi:agamous-like MADS-box protein AGL82 [Spinacia oleracea]|uniref:Agamous-like MADS-box protein AGL82 n=1 Tax=Spinacia oleracea TaxID=3562 RepID=A0ABM3RIZ5_SPIOL|nr:agamous-like MADS-box protein AGL82 [Spinacia oleracea]
MGRRKVDTTQLLQTQKTLIKVFKQRKDGILKKAFELSTLCNTEVAVIIFGPKNGDPPSIWPKDSDNLINILKRFENEKTSIKERRKRATNMNIPCFRNNKDDAGDNPIWNDKFDSFSVQELVGLLSSLETKINVVNAKINTMKNNSVILPLKFEEVQSSGVGAGLQQGMMMIVMGRFVRREVNV